MEKSDNLSLKHLSMLMLLRQIKVTLDVQIYFQSLAHKSLFSIILTWTIRPQDQRLFSASNNSQSKTCVLKIVFWICLL